MQVDTENHRCLIYALYPKYLLLAALIKREGPLKSPNFVRSPPLFSDVFRYDDFAERRNGRCSPNPF